MNWRPEPPRYNWAERAIIAGVLLLVVGAIVAFNQYTYGDWRCMFSECRIEVR